MSYSVNSFTGVYLMAVSGLGFRVLFPTAISPKAHVFRAGGSERMEFETLLSFLRV